MKVRRSPETNPRLFRSPVDGGYKIDVPKPKTHLLPRKREWNGAVRKEITGWSSKSQRRFKERLEDVDYDALQANGDALWAVTLNSSRDVEIPWKENQRLSRAVDRWKRMGIRCVAWCREFGKKDGHVHFHAIFLVPKGMKERQVPEELNQVWLGEERSVSARPIFKLSGWLEYMLKPQAKLVPDRYIGKKLGMFASVGRWTPKADHPSLSDSETSKWRKTLVKMAREGYGCAKRLLLFGGRRFLPRCVVSRLKSEAESPPGRSGWPVKANQARAGLVRENGVVIYNLDVSNPRKWVSK